MCVLIIFFRILNTFYGTMKKLNLTVFLLLFLFSNQFPQDQPYVLLISFDGFRWDYSKRGITPNLDIIKQNGVSALSLRPVYPTITFPNHLSIITGLYPENHGIIQNYFTDPVTGDSYKISDTSAVRNSKWYKGEAFWETAGRQGIITASYFWPGSEVNVKHRRPYYYEKYEHMRDYRKRIDGIVDWLKLPYEVRPHFITLYFDATDTQGHQTGPDSPEINKTIARLDTLMGVLFSELKKIGMYDSTNIIVLSDHGMAEVSKSRVVEIDKIIGDNKDVQWNGPIMMVNAHKDSIPAIYEKLKSHEDHYKVYTKENIPEYFHFSENHMIYPIILAAENRWSLSYGKSSWNSRGGAHGYEKDEMDMHATFMAMGPNFRIGFHTGTLWNIDIYPLLCKLFNIHPRQNIDGRLDRIEFILR